MSAINKIYNISERERIAASCGFVPLFVNDCNDSLAIGQQFCAFPSTDYGLRVQCFECKFGSLWKHGFAPLEDINKALCSNDECCVFIPLKFHMESN
jgi:hypothetical protein